MARQEQDREDLLKEATALVERVELDVEGWGEPIVVGFRRGGEGSVYFGADPVYQFNGENSLRRGFRQGRLLKAERQLLVYLDRRRTETEVQLIREPLDQEATRRVLDEARQHLCRLHGALKEGRFRVLGTVPAEIDVVPRVLAWLGALPHPLVVADTPNVAVPRRNG